MGAMTFASHSGRGVALVALASILWGTTGTAQSLGAGALSPFWVGAAQLAVASPTSGHGPFTWYAVAAAIYLIITLVSGRALEYLRRRSFRYGG